jgi:hypothetical protein
VPTPRTAACSASSAWASVQAKDEIAIANRAPGGPLAMVNAWNTVVGLTRTGPGAARGEPGRYYPHGRSQLRPNSPGRRRCVPTRRVYEDRLITAIVGLLDHSRRKAVTGTPEIVEALHTTRANFRPPPPAGRT